MHKVHCAYPSPALNPFVRTYAERQLESLTSIWTPVPAYLDQLIDFEFRDPITVLSSDGRLGVHSCIVSGAQTEGRAQVLLVGKIHSFAIFFKPSGLSRLFGIPMNQLPNQAFDGASVLGGWVGRLRERLAELSSFAQRVDFIEKILGWRAAAVRANDGMLDTADRLLAQQGVLSVTKTAAECGLSVRQFERKFGAVTGLSPKRCARVARFQSALEAKVARPYRTWVDIAHDLQYHDQMHMIHDFRSLAGAAPGEVLSRLSDQRPPAMLERGEVHSFDS